MTDPLPPIYPGGMCIGQKEEEAVLGVLRDKRLFRYYGPSKGPSLVSELEKAFARHMGARHCLAVNSGTSALICALVGMGIGPGDEVIVPAFTWISTASAVCAVGAVPVVAEIDETLNLDPVDVEAKISQHTSAIIAVHMLGAPCRMDKLKKIADEKGLRILEDTAQAAGGSWQNRRLGTIGDAGAFSLQFHKIITSGEGGLLLTDDDEIYHRANMFHDPAGGSVGEEDTTAWIPGISLRMSELQGAIAGVQVDRLDTLLRDMRRAKRALIEGIRDVVKQKGVSFRSIADPEGDTSTALVLLLPDARYTGGIVRAIQAEGIHSHILFHPKVPDLHVYPHWRPIVQKRAWSPRGGPWRLHHREVDYGPDVCPESLRILERGIRIDISPQFTARQVEQIAFGITKVFSTLL